MITKEQAKVGMVVRWDEHNPALYQIISVDDTQMALKAIRFYDDGRKPGYGVVYDPYYCKWSQPNRMDVIFENL